MNYEAKLPGPAWRVLKKGVVEVKNTFAIKEFDEDNGITERIIPNGWYDYRVLEVNGWKPRQLLIKGEWIDIAGECRELEQLLNPAI